MPPELGRVLVLVGVVLVVFGALAALGVRLPGDITIRGEHGAIYIPIATMIVVSIVLTIVATIFFRR
jgi:xanthine/uracil permease